MNFLSWHYSWGMRFYWERYVYTLGRVMHFFSLELLLGTLFAPWKRLVDDTAQKGFNFRRYFEKVSFNLISRGIGAVVRGTLFVSGLLTLVAVAILGGLGYLVWVSIPVVSVGVYLRYIKSSKNFALGLGKKMLANPDEALSILMQSKGGQFLIDRLGLDYTEAMAALKKIEFDGFEKKLGSFEEMVKFVVEQGGIDKSYLDSALVDEGDMIMAARWWDKKRDKNLGFDKKRGKGRPGMGLELLYGYTPKLDQYVSDLGESREFTHHLVGRQNVVSRIERALSGGAGVVLTGLPGVGKKTVVLEFARRAIEGELGAGMAYKRVLEFDYNFLLSESQDINLKRAKLKEILDEAAAAGNIILMIRDIHRITNSKLEGVDFTDVFESCLGKGDFWIVTIVSSFDYEKYVSTNLRLKKYFEVVEVEQPSMDEAREILLEAADDWEAAKKLVITIPALERILEGSGEYVTETPFPEKALELLDAVILFKEKGSGDDVIKTEDVNAVLTEKTGISFAKLEGGERDKLIRLEEIIHERLVNQDEAVKLIAQILRGKSAGVVGNNRPMGSFMFLGPTGVGKTETAKVLARVYYGDTAQIIRFDMAEYAGREGLERLIGSARDGRPGALTTAIRNKPASLLLLDEIEKAPAEVFNLFLGLLDEGMITDAFDRKVNAKHLFVIATSNAGGEYVREEVLKGVRGSELREKVLEHIFKKGFFSPEFVNRFDGVVVYEPLGDLELRKVAVLLLNELVMNLKKKNIMVEFDERVVEKVVKDGYEPAYGARPMRRVIDLEIGDMLGKGILGDEIKKGEKVMLIVDKQNGQYSYVTARR